MRQLKQGTLIADRFEVDQPTGSGGMGTVYRARDRERGGFVALKLLHPETARGEEFDRFTREAQLLSELRHPGIVSCVAHGQTADGRRFLAMEWLEGHDLSHRLDQGPLSLRDCVTLMEHAAAALAVIHDHGILHRDVAG